MPKCEDLSDDPVLRTPREAGEHLERVKAGALIDELVQHMSQTLQGPKFVVYLKPKT